MKYWVKYRRGSSASAGNWEWKMLYSEALADAEEEAKELASEINESYYWSEHHRGVEWHVLTEAPKWVVASALHSTENVITNAEINLVRLQLELRSAKECECIGEREYSHRCMHCGRTLKRKETV